MTEEDALQVLAAIRAAELGREGMLRFVTAKDRDWLRQRVLQQARRLGVTVTTEGRGERGYLYVRRFDPSQARGYAPESGRREEET